MEGYEKVNKRRVDRRSLAALPQPGRRLVDLSALAAESPRESIAREQEIVAEMVTAVPNAERPATVRSVDQPRSLVDPAVVRIV